jgi:hypothetical protein
MAQVLTAIHWLNTHNACLVEWQGFTVHRSDRNDAVVTPSPEHFE